MRSEWRDVLNSRWRATAVAPFCDVAELPHRLFDGWPLFRVGEVAHKVVGRFAKGLRGGCAEFGGREAFLGEIYLRLYRLQELVALNVAYDVSTLLPGVIIFGSNGGGEAFGFALD